MAHLSQKQLVELFIKTERTADKVLQGKQEIVALDRCRQATREAIRNLEKSSQSKAWITLGSNLVKLEKSKALELLRKGGSKWKYWKKNLSKEEKCISGINGESFSFTDQQVIDVDINKIRSDQKILVNQLRDLEFQSPLKGFDLKPLDRAEISALSANIPRF